MFIPESVAGSRELLPGNSFHLSFPILRPGRITVLASARRRSLTIDSPARYRIEIFHPAHEAAIEVREVEGAGLLTLIELDIDANDNSACGHWLAQITN